MSSVQITITAAQKEAFLRARSAYGYDAKYLRKQAWASIRTMFNIPGNIKLAVELDNTADPLYLVVKDKATKQPLFRDTLTGQVSIGAPVQAAQQAPVDVATTTQTASAVAAQPVQSGQFLNVGGQPAQVYVLKFDRESVVDFLRDSDEGVRIPAPAGLPAIGNGGYVVDSTTGDVYIAA